MNNNLKELSSFGVTGSKNSNLVQAANMYSTDISSNPYGSIKLPSIKQPTQKQPTHKQLKQQFMDNQMAFAGQFAIDAVNNMINDSSFQNGTADQRTQIFENYSNKTIPEFLNTHPLTQGDPMFKASVQAQAQTALKQALDNANEGIGGLSILTPLKVGVDMTKTMFSQLYDYMSSIGNSSKAIENGHKLALDQINRQYADRLKNAETMLKTATNPYAYAQAQKDYDKLKSEYDSLVKVAEASKQYNIAQAPKNDADSLASIIHSAKAQNDYMQQLMKEDPNYADIMKQTEVNKQDGGFTKNLAGMWGARGGAIATNYALTTLPTMLSVAPGAMFGGAGLATASGTEVAAEVINQVASEIAAADAKELMTVPEYAEAYKKFQDMGAADADASARGYLVRQLLQDSNSLAKGFAVGAAFSAVEPVALFAKGTLINRLLTSKIISNSAGGKLAKVLGATTASSVGEGVEETAGNAVANQALGKPLTEDWQDQFFPAMVGAGPLAATGSTVSAFRGEEPAAGTQQGKSTQTAPNKPQPPVAPTEPSAPTEPNPPTPTETAPTETTAPTEPSAPSAPSGNITENPFYKPTGDENVVESAGEIASQIRDKIEEIRTRLSDENLAVTVGNLTFAEQEFLAKAIDKLNASGVQNASSLVDNMLNSFTPEKRRLSGKLKPGDVNLSTQSILDAYASNLANAQASATDTAPTGEITQEPNKPSTADNGVAPTETAPTTPTAPTDVAPTETTPTETTPTETTSNGSLQTRGTDRASPASIAQMQSIAARPIPERLLSDSVEAQNGTPVVTDIGSKITDAQKGTNTIVQSGQKLNGQFVSTNAQWAVVPASSLLTSHNADGVANADYDSNPNKDIRVVSGNGRSAGLTRSYSTGRANDYKTALAEKAQQFGISPGVVQNIDDPVLVRVIDEKDATDEFVRSANETQMLGATSYNQAQLDASAVDANGNRAIPVGFAQDKDGNPTDDTLITFLNIAVPANERLGYLDANDKPNSRLRDRFNAALFYAAYGDRYMFNSIYESEQPGMRNIVTALEKASGAMFGMSFAGKYDLRQYVIDAVMRVVDGKSKGMTFAEIASLTELTGDPIYEQSVRSVLKMFSEKYRSADAMATVLRDFATRETLASEYEQSAAAGGELFVSDAPSPQSIFNSVFNVSEQTGEQNVTGKGSEGTATTDSGTENTESATAEQGEQQDSTQSAVNGTATESAGTSGVTRSDTTETPSDVSPAQPTQSTGDGTNGRSSDTVPATNSESTDTGAGSTTGTTEQRNGTGTGTEGNDVVQGQQAPVISGTLTQAQFQAIDKNLQSEENRDDLENIASNAIDLAKRLLTKEDAKDGSLVKYTTAIITKTITSIATATDRAVDDVMMDLTSRQFFANTTTKKMSESTGGITHYSPSTGRLFIEMSKNESGKPTYLAHELAHATLHWFCSWAYNTQGQTRTAKQQQAIADFASMIRSCFSKGFKFTKLSDEELVLEFSSEQRYKRKLGHDQVISDKAESMFQEFVANAAETYIADGKFDGTPFAQLKKDGNAFVKALEQAIKYILEATARAVKAVTAYTSITDLSKIKEKLSFSSANVFQSTYDSLYARPRANYTLNGIPKEISNWLHSIYDYMHINEVENIASDNSAVDVAVLDSMIDELAKSDKLDAKAITTALSNAVENVRQQLLDITEKQQAPVPVEQSTAPVTAPRNKSGNVATKETPTTSWSLGKDVSWLEAQPTTKEEQGIVRQIISLDGKYESGKKHETIAKLISNALKNGADAYHLRAMVQQLSDMYDQTGDAYIYLSELPAETAATTETSEPTQVTAPVPVDNTALVQNLPTLMDNITVPDASYIVSSVDKRMFGNQFLENNLPMEFPLVSELISTEPIETDVGLSDADALSNYVRIAVAEEFLMTREMFGDVLTNEKMLRKAKDNVRKRITVALGNAVERNEVLTQEQNDTVAKLLSEQPELIEAVDPENPISPYLAVEGLSDEDAVNIALGNGTVRTITSEAPNSAPVSEGMQGCAYGTISDDANAELHEVYHKDLIAEINDGVNESKYINMTDTPAYDEFIQNGEERIMRSPYLQDGSTAASIGEIAGRRLGTVGISDDVGRLLNFSSYNIEDYLNIYRNNPKALIDNLRYYVSAEVLNYAMHGSPLLRAISRGTAPAGYASASDARINTSAEFERDTHYRPKYDGVVITMLHELQHIVVETMCNYQGMYNAEITAPALPSVYADIAPLFVEFAHEVGVPVGREFDMTAWNTENYVESVASGKQVPNETSSVAAENYISKNKDVQTLNFLTKIAGILNRRQKLTDKIAATTRANAYQDRQVSLTYESPRYVFAKDGLTDALTNFFDAMYNQNVANTELNKLVPDTGMREQATALFNCLSLSHQITQSVIRNYAANPNLDIKQALDKTKNVVNGIIADINKENRLFTTSNNYAVLYRNGGKLSTVPEVGGINVPTYAKLPVNRIVITAVADTYRGLRYKGTGTVAGEFTYLSDDVQRNLHTLLTADQYSEEYANAVRFMRNKGVDAVTIGEENGSSASVIMTNNPSDISFDLYYQEHNDDSSEYTESHYNLIDDLSREPTEEQEAIDKATALVMEIQRKNQEAAQQYISDFSDAENTFLKQGLMEPITPNMWTDMCTEIRDFTVDENAHLFSWTSLNLPTQHGGAGTSGFNMEFTLSRNRVLAVRNELAENCIAPLNDYIKDVAERLGIGVEKVATDLGTMYTDLHTLESQRKQEVELEQAVLQAQLLPAGAERETAYAEAMTNLKLFKERQTGEENGFKLYGGKPAKDCMKELTNLSEAYGSVAEEAMAQFRDAFQKVVNIMLERGILSDQYRQYFGDYMYYMPLYTKTQYEDTKINDVIALFSPKQDRSRNGSTSAALDAYTNLNWLVGRVANNLGSKNLGEEIIRSYDYLLNLYNEQAPNGKSSVNMIKTNLGLGTVTGVNGLYVADADFINSVSNGGIGVSDFQQRKAQDIRTHAALLVRRVVPVQTKDGITSVSKNYYVWFNEHDEEYIDNLYFDHDGKQITEKQFNELTVPGTHVTVENHVRSNAKVHKALYEPFHIGNKQEDRLSNLLNLTRKTTSGFGQLFTTYTGMFPVVNAERDFVERATFANGKTYRDADGNAVAGTVISVRMLKNVTSCIPAMVAAYTGKPENMSGVDGQYLTEMKQLGIMNSASITRMLDQNGSKLRAVIEKQLPLFKDQNDRATIAKKLAGAPKQAMRVWAEMLYSVPAYAMYKSLRESNVAPRDAAYYVTEMMNLNMKSSLGRGLSYIFPFVSSIGNTALQLTNAAGLNMYTFSKSKTKRAENAKNMARTGLMMTVGIVGFSAAIPLVAIGLGDGDIDKGYRILDQKPLGAYNYMPVPIGKGDSVKMHLGFGLVPLMFQLAMGMNRLMRNRTSLKTMSFELIDSLIRNNSPVTTPNYDTHNVEDWAKKVMYTITPSLLQPMVAVALNKDYWGSPINRNKFTQETQRVSDTGSIATARGWKSAVKWLYSTTGIDMSPEVLRFIAKSYLAGPFSAFTSYIDKQSKLSDESHKSVRDRLGPILSASGMGSLFDSAGNVDQQAYYSAIEFYNGLIRQSGVYDAIKGKGTENNGPAHRFNTMIQMGFNPMVASDVARLQKMDNDLSKLYENFKAQINDAYMKGPPTEAIKEIANAYYAQRNAYLHGELSQLNYYNNKIDKEADNLPPKEILDIFRGAVYGNN